VTAWAIKEFVFALWNYTSGTWVIMAWKRWLAWVVRSRLDPVKKVVRIIKDHIWGILNAVVLKADNDSAENINSRIIMIKARSRGFRNQERFCNAICFHLGQLDLCPAGIRQ
jgi:transposase